MFPILTPDPSSVHPEEGPSASAGELREEPAGRTKYFPFFFVNVEVTPWHVAAARVPAQELGPRAYAPNPVGANFRTVAIACQYL